jgi:hypothetical protein
MMMKGGRRIYTNDFDLLSTFPLFDLVNFRLFVRVTIEQNPLVQCIFLT